jgi:hypothetical protein
LFFYRESHGLGLGIVDHGGNSVHHGSMAMDATVIGDSLGQRRKVDKGPGVLIGGEVWQWGEQFIGVKGRGGRRSGKRKGGSVELLQCR